MNVFEGLRRLRLAIQGVTILIGVGSMVFAAPQAQLNLETSGPDDGWHLTKGDCDTGTDVNELIFDVPAELSDRISWIELCFRVSPLLGRARPLVAYAHKGGYLWGDDGYSENVQAYVKRRAQQFSQNPDLRPATLAWVELEFRRVRRDYYKSTLALVGSIVIFLEIFGRIAGWIGRGFTTRKAGKDH